MKQEWKAVGSFGTIGLEIVLSILLGLFIGRWLDGKLGTAPLMTVIWFFFGLAAAGRSLWRSVKQMQAEAAREEREQGNPTPLFDPEAERAKERNRDEHPAEKRDEG
jgi:F0F1-type ATP synthase assembly protein I